MRPLSPFSFVALLALTWTGLASAETPNTAPPIGPSEIAAVADMQLDDAFEKTAADDSDDFLHQLAGPTSMDCKNALTRTDAETCVVTVVDGSTMTAPPAALAQH